MNTTSPLPVATESAGAALLSFAEFLAAWLASGSPQWLTADYSTSPDGLYLGTPVHSSNTARIGTDGLPPDVVASLPKEDTHNVRAGALVAPSWTRTQGIVLTVYYSSYCNGWSLFGVGTYLPRESRWVHPSEVFTYSVPDSI